MVVISSIPLGCGIIYLHSWPGKREQLQKFLSELLHYGSSYAKAKDPLWVLYQLLNLSIPILYSRVGRMITGVLPTQGTYHEPDVNCDSIYNLILTSPDSTGGPW